MRYSVEKFPAVVGNLVWASGKSATKSRRPIEPAREQTFSLLMFFPNPSTPFGAKGLLVRPQSPLVGEVLDKAEWFTTAIAFAHDALTSLKVYAWMSSCSILDTSHSVEQK